MANKLMLLERIQAIECDLVPIKQSIEALPDNHDVDIDELQKKVIDMVISIFDHARAMSRKRL